MAALSKALGCELGFGLIQSANSTSRVIWPKEWEYNRSFLNKSINPKRSAEPR